MGVKIQIVVFYEFPEAIWQMIYTTNWIERLNKEIRKIIHSKNSFPTVESAERLLYLILMNYVSRWEKRILRGINSSLYELDLMFEEIYG